MKMWFGKPITEEDIKKNPDASPMGRYEQATIEENGETKLLWLKTVVDDNGEFVFEDGEIKQIETTENTGDPVLKWTGTAFEGLAFSVFYTLQDLARGNWKTVFSDKSYEQRRGRVMMALADGVLIFILMALAKMFFDAYVAENGTEGVDGALVKFMAEAQRKVYNESNVFNNTLGAINTEPVFMSWGLRVGGDMLSLFEGNKELMDVVSRNVGAAEFMK